MKLYLSSFKIGNRGAKFAEMLQGNKRVALISNALDCYSDLDRRSKGEQAEMVVLKDLGIEAEVVDLKDYFGKQQALGDVLNGFDGIWVRGGNVFVLRIAMEKSGFDKLITQKTDDPDFVYAGYSAGCCVLSPSLKGFEIVDSIDQVNDAYPNEPIQWEGLGVLDFVFMPHYKSDHPESEAIDKEVAFLKENNISYKTFSDGEVFISETNNA